MKETGGSTHYLSSKSWRPKVKETGNSLVPASKFLAAQSEEKRKTNFTSSSHLELLQAQSDGNRKLNSLVFASKW